MSIGKRIRIVRQNSNLTQSELAEKCDLTQANMSDYERDKASPPIPVLKKMTTVCKVNFEWVATGDGAMIPHTESDDSVAFKMDKILFKGCLTAVLTLTKKYNLIFEPSEISDITIALYKHFIINKLTSIDELSDEELIDIVKVLAA